MLRNLIAVLIIAIPTTCWAQQRQFYDSNGNFVGSSNTNQVTGQTYFYGQQGQILGNTNPGAAEQTYVYDSYGNNIGTIK